MARSGGDPRLYPVLCVLDKSAGFLEVAVSTVLTLFITTIVLSGFVAVSHLEPDLFCHEHERHEPDQGVVHEEPLAVSWFATMVPALESLGWIIEAAITGAVVPLRARVIPDLLGPLLHRENVRRPGGLQSD